ncbi:hypothetical protein BC749_104227 [Flavobacterium araucananum]|jgi:hypothetical protein|uniref:IPT/TIG domain-containing protein n=1 Tax=Flavobacterium araucananum TaxID=946678 RepID=A0A227PFW0_9FLAO|nr:hypothetical protein [Flavobacterium araucananum]OXG08393.1 hypothetical protein B0A64_06420 [Flavobacterium araucananum]PWJ99074.1 hypothetical protein BC749_104227 [Flavobacterium araucananum]
MKNIKIVSLTACMAWMLSLMFFASCSNDDGASAYTGAPVIESVSRSGYDLDGKILPSTPVTIGDPKNYYIIHGKGLLSTTKVYFNDFDTYFRPTFVTDTDIIVLIDENTPFADASNQLKVVTGSGTATFDFKVAPPVPTFSSFNFINCAEGDEVTIKGKYFLDPIVTLAKTATEPAVPVTVISSTLEQIVVKIPANAKYRNLAVTNISGTATSLEAIGTALYDDKMYGMQWGGPWSGKGINFDFDGDAYQGEKSWQWTFGPWDGGNFGFDYDLSPYKAMRIAVKGSKNGQVNFNINDGPNYVIPVTTTWVYLEIPLSKLGNPTSVTKLTFQESNNDGGNTVLFDDLGFVLK